MALARARRNDSGFNYWPGFVDALSTLVLSIVFLLSVFLVVQFFLSQEVTGKDKALEQLNAKIAQLNDLLSLEKLGKITLDDQVGQLRAGLAAAESERDRIKGLYEGLAGAGGDAQGRANELNKALESEKSVSSRALAQIEVLNQQISALRRQLAALEEALEVSEKRDKESQGRIADLGQRLNVALAQRVQELSRYRSEFFGRLRAILGNRPDIRIVGDRFVFQSEVFFDTGQALLLPEGRAELDKLATALIDLDKQIPSELAWVLRVDGHTDMRPINSPLFKSNWELSSARAISVVQYLVFLGVPAQRLVAAGFAEFQPLDTAPTEDAYKRNRRIELKLTERRGIFHFAPIAPQTRTPASRYGSRPGGSLIPRSISTPASTGGASAGVVSWCRRPTSSPGGRADRMRHHRFVGFSDQVVAPITGDHHSLPLVDEAKRHRPIASPWSCRQYPRHGFYERCGLLHAGEDVIRAQTLVLKMAWKP
jgi:chemotaxis protein MotB